MVIFGRVTARQRLRRATRESLAIPAFTSPVDCTPWVIGGLWPAELSTVNAQTAELAAYLKDDLQRIADSANDALRVIKLAGLSDPARHAEEARVIDEARFRAAERVESTVRHLRAMEAGAMSEISRRRPNEPADLGLEETQVIPATTDVWRPAVAPDQKPAPNDPDQPEVAPDVHPAQTTSAVGEGDPADIEESRRADGVNDVSRVSVAPPEQPVGAVEPHVDRLNRVLEFVVRQESRLNWAVGDREDGTTVLVTDLAHGWIPAGITLPEGVRLLTPERRTGRAAALIGDTVRMVAYAPGDTLRRSVGFAATRSSLEPRKLPLADDVAGVLSELTRRREGLPRIVHRLAAAAAEGAPIVDQEVDVLRVHLDTARYQLLIRYPNVDSSLLLNCLLLAATEGIASGEVITANYHLAWYQTLARPISESPA